MKTTRILGAFGLGIGLTFAAGPPALETFVCKEGGFQARMPTAPIREVLTEGPLFSVSWSVESRDGIYWISYVDLPLPKDMPDARVQAMLDQSRDSTVETVRGAMTKSSNVLFAGKFPGRVYEAKTIKPEALFRGRIYLVGNRLYRIHVLGRQAYATSADATTFLESFALMR